MKDLDVNNRGFLQKKMMWRTPRDFGNNRAFSEKKNYPKVISKTT